MDGRKGGGQDGGDIAGKATRVRAEKLTQISILFDKDGRVANALSLLDKIRAQDAPHYTAKIPLKGDIHRNPTLSERQPFISFLCRDLFLYQVSSLLPKPLRKGLRKIGNLCEFAKTLEIQ